MRDPLLERDDVLARGMDGLRAARSGRGGTLILTGDAGTGKSSVLSALSEGAEGFACHRVCGEEMESGLAFAVLDRLLEAIDPGGSPESGSDERPVIEPSVPYVRALERLRRRAESPLLLVIDDLHWADADSLNAVAFLARRLQAGRFDGRLRG